MTEIRKILNKDNLKYYVEKMLNDKEFRKEVIKNCVYVDANIAIADPNASVCYINETLAEWQGRDIKESFEDMLDKYIPEKGAVDDFLNNCLRLDIKLEGKNEDICVNYHKENEEGK